MSFASGAVGYGFLGGCASLCIGGDSYSVTLLGDTHFDSTDTKFYHSDYLFSTSKARYEAHLKEHVRNAEMWRERMPALLKASAACVRSDAAFVLQLGDLVQGDCNNTATHRRMLSDAFSLVKGAYGGRLPLVTVVGNHDIRGDIPTDGTRETFDAWQPPMMSRELGVPVRDTTFLFRQGPDAYVVVDFNEPRPDFAKLCRLLGECADARHVFLVTHGPFIPNGMSRWSLCGSTARTDDRRELTRILAKLNAIVLAGHTHRVEFYDCAFPEGRITQFVASSVWTKPELASIEVVDSGAGQYGRRAVEAAKAKRRDRRHNSLVEYTEEFKPYMKDYLFANAAGHYVMDVSDYGVKIHFYGGAATSPSRTFVLRGRA